jgi:hypothetical protein
MKRNSKILFLSMKDCHPKVCAVTTSHMFVFSAKPQHNFFENLAQLKYLGMALTSENFMKRNIKNS